MPHTLELPDELADALTDEAARAGMTLPDYAIRLLSTRPAPAEVRTGQDLVAFWRAEGLIGTRPDVTDSQAHARTLREQAEHRGGDDRGRP